MDYLIIYTKMADHIADLHMVLTTSGVSVEATRTLIINNESLT